MNSRRIIRKRKKWNEHSTQPERKKRNENGGSAGFRCGDKTWKETMSRAFIYIYLYIYSTHSHTHTRYSFQIYGENISSAFFSFHFTFPSSSYSFISLTQIHRCENCLGDNALCCHIVLHAAQLILANAVIQSTRNHLHNRQMSAVRHSQYRTDRRHI